jgi:phosphoribosyl 1,2-cyclic phosphodiesterase
MGTLHILGSGSKGNATVVAGPQGALLIDCGFSKKTFLGRCETLGVDPHDIAGIVITHEHTDHIAGLGVCLRGLARLGIVVPVYATARTQASAGVFGEVDRTSELVTIRRGDTFEVAGLRITTFATSHDAAEPLGLRIDNPSDDPFAIGYMTDTGCLTGEAAEHLRGVDLLALETNHDTKMLQNGTYPYPVKRRIASDGGHLSNLQATQALEALLDDRLKAVVGMHLSENNNDPQLALSALRTVLEHADHPARASVARQYVPLSIEV